MPIHDQGYRHYVGQRVPHGRAWWVIARMHIIGALKQRWFLMVMIGGWGQFVARAIQIYLSSSFQQASFLAATSKTFRDFFDAQSFFVFVIAIALGGLIADDRRANALQLYLSKPLTRAEYIMGKLVPALVFVLSVTFAPAMMLLLVQVVLAGSTTFIRENLFLLPAITLYSIVQALLAAFGILALSSLTKSRRFVSVMYAGTVFFTGAMYQALRAITGSSTWAVISPGQMLDVVADRMFRVRADPPVPVFVAVLVLLVLIGASIWILERRIRAVEVVA
jgi:ABC-2 type transport system permease protein